MVAAAKAAKAVSGDENQEMTILAMASERYARPNLTLTLNNELMWTHARLAGALPPFPPLNRHAYPPDYIHTKPHLRLSNAM